MQFNFIGNYWAGYYASLFGINGHSPDPKIRIALKLHTAFALNRLGFAQAGLDEAPRRGNH